MTLLTFKHLRSDVVGSTANSSLALAIELKLRCETEVTYLDLHLIVEEQVTELEITMDDAMRVEILQSINHLLSVAFDLQLVESLSALQQFIHALILAQLKQDIHIFTVFEEMKKLGHISMLD